MTNRIRIVIETGPKDKKVAAIAPDWPGFERGAKTEEAAIERLLSYLPRYAKMTRLAGMETEFTAISGIEVVEHYSLFLCMY